FQSIAGHSRSGSACGERPPSPRGGVARGLFDPGSSLESGAVFQLADGRANSWTPPESQGFLDLPARAAGGRLADPDSSPLDRSRDRYIKGSAGADGGQASHCPLEIAPRPTETDAPGATENTGNEGI